MKNQIVFLALVFVFHSLAFADDHPNIELDFIKNGFALNSSLITKEFNAKGSPACVQFWTGLSSITNEDVGKKVIAGQLQIPTECTASTTQLTNEKLVQQIIKGCDAKGTKEELASQCLFFVIELRTALIDQMTEPGDPFEKLPAEILADKFFSRMLVWNESTKPAERFDQLMKMLSVLQDRHPASPLLAKAQVWIQFMQLKADGKKASERPLLEALASAKKLRPHDDDLQEMNWLLMVERRDQAGLEKDLKSYLQEEPKSKVGLYYLAGLNWMRKDRKGAVSVLKQAQKIYPKDERIAATLKTLKTAKYGDNAFSANIGFNFF